jgi:hydrogenase-1 operon protein HyaF
MSAVDHKIAEKVLLEVEAGLASLLDEGTAHVIDLRHLPRMSEAAYNFLQEALGRGEVSVLVDTTARVEIIETSIPGVWWATYRRPSGDIATEIIEIAFAPRMLTAGKAEAAAGLKRLQQRNVDQQRGDAA